ncbi:MAG: hypothetical protein U9O64_10835 [Campylobacterota bacterium]|nr:hypothetical protein [Campylobacterota bacterium]
MKSNTLKSAIYRHLIHFESEGMNYFENPFSSDVGVIDCAQESKKCWHTMDPSTSEKPLTVVIDLEARGLGDYTGRVKGFYLLNETIRKLKTYEGDHGFNGNLEYYAFEVPSEDIIEEVDSPVDEKSFGYQEGFKEKLLALLC